MADPDLVIKRLYTRVDVIVDFTNIMQTAWWLAFELHELPIV